MASIEDAAEYGERADALVSGLLGRVMRQEWTSRRRWTTSWRCRGRRGRTAGSWRRGPGMRGPHRMQALLSRRKWSWEEVRDPLPGLAQDVRRMTRMT